ncbi:transcription factor MYB124-like [Andrographis paniculata]|uniref:transcription factor MYB124-like n=1 Tax=Andrographis paniculata TaxID=175694 RepID=UPI0021E6D9E1|nr:transcription factor MYB124-like [Andrographis paniculata]
MKKTVINSTDSSNGGLAKQKERHIVSWSQEEDDILREQISAHGTENWAIIASKFKDKTTRQCRRRWFTYLNSDFKKGGWSPEEDMLLCEAQKIFGNRWTEIAKVVSGRTDNAVKNRFTTLCKRRAKHEALSKENNATSYINLNNKRIAFSAGSETDAPLKKIRAYISNSAEEAQNGLKGASMDSSENNKIEGTFLKKDDPKVIALMQQAELLSSLAALQNFRKQNKGSDSITFNRSEAEFQIENCREMVEDLRSSNEGSIPSWREGRGCDSSPASSEYSTGSTLLSNPPAGNELLSNSLHDVEDNNVAARENSVMEFSSPLHVTPLFRAFAAAIPSPKFSESEKHFLMKTLGMESPSPSAITNPNPSQPPPCKRSLLHCL